MGEEASEAIYKFMQPPALNLAKANNAIDNLDREFSHLCAWLQTEGVPDPQNLSMYDLEQYLLFFQKRYDKRKKH